MAITPNHNKNKRHSSTSPFSNYTMNSFFKTNKLNNLESSHEYFTHKHKYKRQKLFNDFSFNILLDKRVNLQKRSAALQLLFLWFKGKEKLDCNLKENTFRE